MKEIRTQKELEEKIGIIVERQLQQILRVKTNNIRFATVVSVNSSQSTISALLGGNTKVLDNIKYQSGVTSDVKVGDSCYVISSDPTFSTNLRAIVFSNGNIPEVDVRFRGYMSVQQDNLVSGDITLVNLDTKDFDTVNAFNTTTHLFTVPYSGYYGVWGSVSFTSVVADRRYTALILVDGAEKTQTIFHSSHAQRCVVPCHDTFFAEQGQTISLGAFTDAGVNTVDVDDGTALTYLNIALMKQAN